MKAKWFTILIIVIFALIFSSISLVNHYLFRTGALDYGLYLSYLYDYLHFNFSYVTLHSKLMGLNTLADHFTPIIFLFAPFSLIFGTYTYLVIQIFAILFGGYGIYKIAYDKNRNSWFASIMMLHFFGIWAIYSALSFNWYTNFFAVMFVPWLFYYYEKRNVKLFIIFFLIIILCKENMSLWLFFIMAGLIVKDYFLLKIKPAKWVYIFGVISIIYFVAITFYVMPLMAKGRPTQLEFYSLLGKGGSDILHTLFTHPKYVFSLLFESTKDGEFFRGIKSEFYYVLLLSGGILFFYRPYYLIMILPLLAQKMFHENPVVWGINYHYSVEFIPLLSLVIIDYSDQFETIRKKLAFAVATVLITHLTTISTLESRKSFYFNRSEICYYYNKHYETKINISEVNKIITEIPQNAKVSASCKSAPHLSLRDTTYLFPQVFNADFIVCLYDENDGYPLSYREYLQKIDALKQSKEFKIYKETKDIIVFKKSDEYQNLLKNIKGKFNLFSQGQKEYKIEPSNAYGLIMPSFIIPNGPHYIDINIDMQVYGDHENIDEMPYLIFELRNKENNVLIWNNYLIINLLKEKYEINKWNKINFTFTCDISKNEEYKWGTIKTYLFNQQKTNLDYKVDSVIISGR